MSVRLRRLFLERPLTRKDYPALLGHAVTEAGERPPLGFAPDAYDNRLVLQALGLTVSEGVVSSPGGLPWSLFHSDLPPEVEDAWEDGPC